MFGLGIIQKVKIIRRLNKILFVLFKHGFSFFIYKAGLNKYLPFFLPP
jgi:hypothetical protein